MALLELDGVTRRYGALVALDQVAMRMSPTGPCAAAGAAIANSTATNSARLSEFTNIPRLPKVCRKLN